MPHMEEAYVYLDGGYHSKISKHLGEGVHLKVDMKQFGITLAKQNKLWCSKVFYYTAPPYVGSNPNNEEKKKRADYDRFAHIMKKIPDFCFREGRCQKAEDDYNQKGVDTLITMDLMEMCKNKKIKNIVILTSDTDFVPILNKLKDDFGINVILAYYCDFVRNGNFSMSNHLWACCNNKFLISKKHFDLSKRKKKDESIVSTEKPNEQPQDSTPKVAKTPENTTEKTEQSEQSK